MRDDDTVEKESMEYELAYEIIDSTGSKIEASEAVAKICDNDIHINGFGHAPLKLSFNDVRQIENKSWLIELTFSDGCIIVLKKLGRLFDSFLDEVMAEYKKTAKKALLMQEKELSVFHNASFSFITENTSISERGSVHVQETGLMFASEKGDMHRIPYAFTEALEQKQWSFLIKLRNGSVYTIGMLERNMIIFQSHCTKQKAIWKAVRLILSGLFLRQLLR